MSNVAKTRHLPDTSLNVVNRNAGTIPKNKIVGVGTPTGNEFAIDSLHAAGASAAIGSISEDVETGKSTTLHGPGSIEAIESDGSGTIASGAEVIAVAGASLAAGGRVKTLPASTGTYYVVGRSVSPGTIAAVAGDLCLVRLCEPRKIIVA